MDQERVTRSSIPTVCVTMPLSLKTWLDDEAERRGLSRSALVVALVVQERQRQGVEAEGVDSEAIPA